VSAALLRLVTRQGGVLTRVQALEHCSAAEVRARLRRGEWRRTPWRGIYLDGELPPDPARVVRAASLWLGGDLVACHSTAALLWGFDVGDRRTGQGDLHFLGPTALDNRSLDGLRVHPSSLGSDDAVQRDGVWCTPAARTACDVVRRGAPIDGLATLDLALRARCCSREDLAVAAERQAGLREVVRLRALIPHADGRAESPMESRMRWRFIDGGLPPPQLQVDVGEAGRRHRLDTGWEEWRLGAEFDGLDSHMTRGQLDADRDRHNWLAERSWSLLHFTALHVYRRPEQMVATVQRQAAQQRRVIMALGPPMGR
jgi:very-short-patch-repair endonuclease